jgi:hypothetical protein
LKRRGGMENPQPNCNKTCLYSFLREACVVTNLRKAVL